MRNCPEDGSIDAKPLLPASLESGGISNADVLEAREYPGPTLLVLEVFVGSTSDLGSHQHHAIVPVDERIADCLISSSRFSFLCMRVQCDLKLSRRGQVFSLLEQLAPLHLKLRSMVLGGTM